VSPLRVAVLALALSLGLPGVSAAQNAAPPSPPADDSRLWIVAGGGSTTLLGDCTDCEGNRYLHSAHFLGNAGISINERTDFGGEVLWVPQTLSTGDEIKVTFVMSAVQFRPWRTQGFFLKAGLGMAFLRNWLSALEDSSPPIRSKAFALGLGAGWEFPVGGRVGVQLVGAQHAAALGDLQTSERTVENVMANFWSVGAAIVIR